MQRASQRSVTGPCRCSSRWHWNPNGNHASRRTAMGSGPDGARWTRSLPFTRCWLPPVRVNRYSMRTFPAASIMHVGTLFNNPAGQGIGGFEARRRVRSTPPWLPASAWSAPPAGPATGSSPVPESSTASCRGRSRARSHRFAARGLPRRPQSGGQTADGSDR